MDDDDDDDDTSGEDAATLALDVVAFDVMDGDGIWLLVVEEMLTSKLSSISESLCS